jgi:hypothetical protein
MKALRVLQCLGVAALLLGPSVAWSAAASAADVAETARAVAAKYRKAVVTVRLVVKMKIEVRGQNMDQEQKLEATGIVVDPGGLTVADASTLDPASLVKTMLGAMGGRNIKIDSEIKEALLLLDDGLEVEADVVLTDADLGLAFVRPREEGRTFDAVPLAPRPATAQLLDPVIALGRLGKLGNREATLSVDAIRAVVKGPRLYYVPETKNETGYVAFAADGGVLGVYVMKQKPQGAEGEAGGMSSISMLANPYEMQNTLMSVIRPVNDVIEIAAQAKQVKLPQRATPADAGTKQEPKEQTPPAPPPSK